MAITIRKLDDYQDGTCQHCAASNYNLSRGPIRDIFVIRIVSRDHNTGLFLCGDCVAILHEVSEIFEKPS